MKNEINEWFSITDCNGKAIRPFYGTRKDAARAAQDCFVSNGFHTVDVYQKGKVILRLRKPTEPKLGS